jgi:hypothetical protein
MVDAASSESFRQQPDSLPRRVRIFINYRHEDTKPEAWLLYERLAGKFGGENIFLDRPGIPVGSAWLDEITSHIDSCHIFLSLIGRSWLSIMRLREQAASVNPAEDYVRFEIQRAMEADSGTRVVPVLVEDTPPFSADEMPGSLRAFAKLQAAQFRCDFLESDTGLLISRIEALALEQSPAAPESAATLSDEKPPTPILADAARVAPPPDAAHYEDVLEQMVDEGNLVLFLGSQLATERAGRPGETSSPPGDKDLAAALAERFGIKEQLRPALPEIAQYVYTTKGRAELWRALKKLAAVHSQPRPVHRFLAGFPGTLRKLGLPIRYQLIVSANFDQALEQAFDDAGEPYDLAVYMASGQDEGKFVHFPVGESPRPVNIPNAYFGFKIGNDGELWKTLIVKIHGAVDGKIRDYHWQENYVITEDHYIDYLSMSPIHDFVPGQILAKLKESHCLFLGHTVRDWNHRVFLKRIWDETPGATSWAVEPDPDLLEKRIWAETRVDLYASGLADYVGQLQARLIKRTEEITRS